MGGMLWRMALGVLVMLFATLTLLGLCYGAIWLACFIQEWVENKLWKRKNKKEKRK